MCRDNPKGVQWLQTLDDFRVESWAAFGTLSAEEVANVAYFKVPLVARGVRNDLAGREAITHWRAFCGAQAAIGPSALVSGIGRKLLLAKPHL